jgi:RecB family exonuclease
LIRTADLQTFRDALVALATGGAPFDARNRLVVVPTRAAARHLLRAIEDRSIPAGGVLVRPDMATPGELLFRLAGRLDTPPALLTGAEREVLLGVASRVAREDGTEPPFRLKPALVAEALRFYDELRRHQKDVDAFERLVLGRLEPSAPDDRGAARLAQQTRFLVSAFRTFETLCQESGNVDEHDLRGLLLAGQPSRPYRHLVLAVTSRAFAAIGVPVADWDLLARLPGLERLDVVVTDGSLAGAPHEWFHRMLPGLEEVRFEPARPAATPSILVPPDGGLAHVGRDREEEVAGFARRARRAIQRADAGSLDRIALVVRPPLPYLYLGRTVLGSASLPCQSFDALPLAAEPVAAALDLVLSCVSSNFARDPCVALLRSPHFAFGGAGRDPAAGEGRAGYLRDVAALDRALAEAGFLGERAALERLVASWDTSERPRDRRPPRVRAARAGRTLLRVVEALEPSSAAAPVATHLTTLIDFWHRHERSPHADDVQRPRHLRARGGLLTVLESLRDAYARFDHAPATIDEVSALVRRWIEGHTFGLPSGEHGIHIVDAVSAPFGEFDLVQLAGLVDGEWPEPPRHDTFYSAGILRDLGWPLEADRLEQVRAAFIDLLRLPSKHLAVSTFRLELDALVAASPLLDEVEHAGMDTVEEPPVAGRIFDHEALALDPVVLAPLPAGVQDAARLRLARPASSDSRYHGSTGAHRHAAYSLSALERYQTCPFKFFAADVLRLEEPADDATTVSPRTRGKLLHEVFQRFFEAWDARAVGEVTPERIDEARAVMAEAAEPILAALPESERQIERARLFGSAVAAGAAEVVLAFEASRVARVSERHLEHRFEGDFGLDGSDGRRLPLRGIADRIDLLEDGRLRVIDYKSKDIWDRGRALQVPVYTLCAQEQLPDPSGKPREVAEAGYVTLGGKQPFVAIVKEGDTTARATLADVRARVLELVDRVERGEFPPRPHDLMDCRFCPYPAVCRKDYVGDDD